MNQQHYRDKLADALSTLAHFHFVSFVGPGALAGMLLSGVIPDIPAKELGIGLAILSGFSLAASISYNLRSRIYRRNNA